MAFIKIMPNIALQKMHQIEKCETAQVIDGKLDFDHLLSLVRDDPSAFKRLKRDSINQLIADCGHASSLHQLQGQIDLASLQKPELLDLLSFMAVRLAEHSVALKKACQLLSISPDAESS